MKDIGTVVLIWAMCWIFSRIAAIPQYVKDVVLGGGVIADATGIVRGDTVMKKRPAVLTGLLRSIRL